MKHNLAKGTMYMMVARFVFLVAGYIINILLGRLLGPSDYGVFGIVISYLIIAEMLLMRGLPQSIAKYLAESDFKKSIMKKGVMIQLFFGVVIFVLYFLSAPYLAAFAKDVTLVNFFRLSSLIILPLALFNFYVNGYLNGLHKFKEQAIFRGLNSILKLIFVLILVFFGYRINGAILGYVLAAAVSYVTVRMYLKISGESGPVSLKRILIFAVPLIITSFSVTLLRHLDLIILKNILVENFKAGIYTAALSVSKVSNSIFSALSFTILPSIAKAKGDIELTKKYISNSLRYMIMFLFPLSAIVSATASSVIGLLYSEAYVSGASSLSILIFGSSFLALFSVLNMIIIGNGSVKMASISALFLILLSIVLNYMLIPVYGVEGAAIATTITMFIGVLILSLYVIFKFRSFVSFRSLFNIVLSSFIVYFVALKFQFEGYWLILSYVLYGIVYLGLLFVLNEVKKKDINIIKDILH